MTNKTLLLLFFLLNIVILPVSCTEDEGNDLSMREEIIDQDDPQAENRPDGNKGKEDEEEQVDGEFSFTLYADNSYSNQSADIFNDYLIIVPRYRSKIYMYNLKNKKRLCYCVMTSMNELNAVGGDIYHCNQTSFGVDYYDGKDPFPLLYISQRSRSDKRCFTEVFRILPKKDTLTHEYVSIDVQHVQTIYYPPMSEENSLGNVNTVIDKDNHLLYTYSRNNTKTDGNYKQCKISCFAIPDIHQEVVYLEDKDIKSSFMIDCSAFFMQGAFIRNETLYISRGATSVGYIDINVVDLKNKKLKGQYNLLENGYRWEPEGCFWYNGHLMIATGKNIWEMSSPIIE